MIQFVLIKPSQKKFWNARFPSIDEAMIDVGLKPGEVDYGVLHGPHGNFPGLGMVVYEYSLFMAKEKQRYFRLGSILIAGNAILFGFDEMGDTVNTSINNMPTLAWFANHKEVERSIARGEVGRPTIRANGQIVWQWPQPQH